MNIPETFSIRSFREEDAESVVALWRACNLTVEWNDPMLDIERKKAVQPELLLVGTCQNKIVASVMAGYDGHRGWLNYLAVDPEHRMRGFGSAIIAEAEKLLGSMGCPKINLQVRTANKEVIGFYRSLGYEVDDVVGLGKRIVPD